MRGDVALAGIVFSAEDWASYDPAYRAELMAAATRGADAWVVGPATGALSGPMRMPTAADDRPGG
jgi:hypothetical protein